MKWLFIGLMVFTIVSCRMTRPVQLPVVKNVPDSFAVAADINSIANTSWKQFFTDTNLVALIDTALNNNPDLFIASQRVEMAKAQLYMRRA
ncbi:MAG: hypothetical protein J7497_05670, partial [Chitinophagaceae bacterium]|nr:hypothetical protein [Chitinophagaceae bacterium]